MRKINAERGQMLQVPRDLALLFKDNQAAARAFNAFLTAMSAKVDNSSSSLEEVEQRGGNPSIARVHELEKRIDALESQLRPPRRGDDVEKRIEDIELALRPNRKDLEHEKRIEDLERMLRPSRKDTDHEKRIEALEVSARKSTNLNEILKRLDDIDASGRPRS